MARLVREEDGGSCGEGMGEGKRGGKGVKKWAGEGEMEAFLGENGPKRAPKWPKSGGKIAQGLTKRAYGCTICVRI